MYYRLTDTQVHESTDSKFQNLTISEFSMSPFDFLSGETLLVNKPHGWTSFDVVNKVRYTIKKELGIKKIKLGHAGTLDPLATGLLILCTGKSTKKIDEFIAYDKEYTGTFTLGATTPSYDLETEPDRHFPTDHISEETVRETAKQFTGAIRQVPPMFSAKKIDGKRAYKYARKDQEIEMRANSIVISAFEITAVALPEVHFRIACSKGTYIRALARDFGEALNTGAHLTALCRTRIGPWHLRDAFEVEDLVKAVTIGRAPE
jgi:tRNA pseudouridine55 synthase